MPQFFGWTPNPREVDRVLRTLPTPRFFTAACRDTGKGKTVLLHEPLAKLLGTFPVHKQEIGDCVSHGWGLGVDVLKAVEIVVNAENEQFLAETATEFLYHCGRVDQGGGQLGEEDGSLGAWQAKAVQEQGTVARLKYGDVDLTSYSGRRAKEWGSPRAKIPADVDATGREHPVKTVSLVSTYEEARDAIANGYPVPVCSMQGFAETRDADGFARPQGQWAHCMLFLAVDDSGRRPGLLCMNSWGPDWINGPTRLNQPPGSFWVDAATADKMLRNRDSFAISAYAGFPARTLPENWAF